LGLSWSNGSQRFSWELRSGSYSCFFQNCNSVLMCLLLQRRKIWVRAVSGVSPVCVGDALG
jgi:hypothetical protein